MTQKSMEVCRELIKWSEMEPGCVYDKATGKRQAGQKKGGLTEFQYIAEKIMPMAEEALKEDPPRCVVIDGSKKGEIII